MFNAILSVYRKLKKKNPKDLYYADNENKQVERYTLTQENVQDLMLSEKSNMQNSKSNKVP